MITQTEFLKKRFDIVRKWCAQNGIVPQVAKIRTSEVLKDGVGTYEFDFQHKNPQYTGEVMLNRNDLFIPFQMGILLSFDDATAPTGKSQLYSFAPKAGVNYPVAFATDDIEAFYNGVLIQTVNQTQIQQAYPLELYKFVPETQNAILAGGEASLGLQAEWDIKKVLPVLVPNVLIAGNMDITTRVEFNGTASSFALKDASGADVTGKAAYLNLIMYGVLAKNMAESAAMESLSNQFQALG